MIIVLILYLLTRSLLLTLSQPHPQMLHKKFPRLLARIVPVVARDKQAVIEWLVEHGAYIDVSRHVRRYGTFSHPLAYLYGRHVYGILVVEEVRGFVSLHCYSPCDSWQPGMVANGT